MARGRDTKSNLGIGCVPFTHQSLSAARGRPRGTWQRGGTRSSGHLPGPRSASGTEIAAGGPEAASGAVTALGRMGPKGRKSATGWGRQEGDSGRARQPESAEVRTVQRAARIPEARAPAIVTGAALGPASESAALDGEAGSHQRSPPSPHPSFQVRPYRPLSHLHPHPRWVSSRDRDSHELPPSRHTAVIVPCASYLQAPAAPSYSRPTRSAAPGPRLQRARWLGAVSAAGALGY